MSAATETSEPLFECVEDALKFCFRYNHEQYSKPLDGKPLGSGKGLVGNDGAGQAGMISREVRALGDMAHSVLFVKYAEQHSECPMCHSQKPADDWRGICRWIAEEMRKEIAPEAHIKLMSLLVERHFSVRKPALTDVASRFGDGESKVKHIAAALKPALIALESKATRRLRDRLGELKMIQAPDVDEAA